MPSANTARNAIRAPLFDFKKRALVHFAADPAEVHMPTRLAGEKTHFLPFNRGSHPNQIICGVGNPQHESVYRTGYFWEDVLQFESFLDIRGRFLFLGGRKRRPSYRHERGDGVSSLPV